MTSQNDKYRNPSVASGIKKESQSEVKFKTDVNFEKAICHYLNYIIDLGIFNDDDYANLSDFIIESSDDDEGEYSSLPMSSKEVKFQEEKLYDSRYDSCKKNNNLKKKRKCSDDSRDSCKKNNNLKKKQKSSDDSSSEKSDYSSIHSRHKKSQKGISLSLSKREEEKRDSSSSLGKSEEKYVKAEQKEVPQHVYGFYECKVCNITVSSLVTYESHMKGKRHMKALKALNVVETVSQTLPAGKVGNRYPNTPPGIHRVKVKEPPLIQDVIDQLKTPCPGLYHVTEIQGLAETSYYCALCDSPCSTASILPHLQGFKHLLKCLKYFNPEVYKEISYEPKYKIEGDVIHILRSVENKKGKGKMTVKKDIFRN